MKTAKNAEYEKFDSLASELLRVPHDTIKHKIDAEKNAKKRKKSKKSSASRAGA